MMKSTRNFFAAGILLLLCVICQFCSFCLQRTPSAIVTPSAAQPSPSLAPISGVHPSPTPQNSVRAERDLTRQYQKLRKLESQAEFLEFTEGELRLAKAFKANSAYFDMFLRVDMERPDLLEHVMQLRKKHEDRLQDELALLEDYIEQEDFADLTEKEFNILMDYVENRQRWAQIAYDDSVDLETKVAVCKSWYEPWAEIWQILNQHFETVHGSAYRDFKSAYDCSGLEAIIRYTNPWWINRTAVSYLDENQQRHHFRVKLFEE